MIKSLEEIKKLLREFDAGKHSGKNWYRMLKPLLASHIKEMNDGYLDRIEPEDDKNYEDDGYTIIPARTGYVYFIPEDNDENLQ